MTEEMLRYEREARGEGRRVICGIDEAGRGPLAGPVFAAAVVFDGDVCIPDLDDSKKVTPRKRELLFDEITAKAAAFCVAQASVEEIDRVNILNATFLAMRRAVEGLSLKPDFALVDGNRDPGLFLPTLCVIKGDSKSASVAAASILAKVSRDRLMRELDKQYPQYEFARHKGYGTALHYERLAEYGPCPVHRISFLKKAVLP